jgi:hypothetical protein
MKAYRKITKPVKKFKSIWLVLWIMECYIMTQKYVSLILKIFVYVFLLP